MTHNLDSQQLLALRDIKRITSWSRSTIYRKINAGLFPQPLDVGNHSKAWRVEAVNEWLNNLQRFTETDHSDKNKDTTNGQGSS